MDNVEKTEKSDKTALFTVTMTKTVKVKLKNAIQKPNLLYRYMHRFLLSQLLFGYDYGSLETTSKLLKYLVKLTCFMIALSISLSVMVDSVNLDFKSAFSYFIHVIEYMLNVTVVLIKAPNFSSFFKSFNDVDVKLKLSSSHYALLELRLLFAVFVAVSLKVLSVTLFCSMFRQKCLPSQVSLILSFHSCIALDCLRVTVVVMFFCVYYRLKCLRVQIKKKYDGPVFKHRDSNSVQKDCNVATFEDIYRTIADNVDTIKPLVDAMFTAGLFANVPYFMLLIYEVLIISKTQVDLLRLIFLICNVLHMGVLLGGPCITAELASAEVDHIKLILYNHLLKGEDEKSYSQIQLFYKYTELRSFKYRIYRLVPIDMTLPLSLLSLCTTYLIVIIQFTHLYD